MATFHARTRWLLGMVVALGCAGLVPGCAGLAPRPPGLPAEKPGDPKLIYESDSGQPYVIGLPERHRWRPGDRLVLEQPGAARGAATAVVTEAYRGAVQVALLCQVEQRLEGLSARRLAEGEPARAGRCGGRVVEGRGDLWRLDLGQQEGVRSGDRYEVLEPETHRSVALLQVQKLEQHAASCVPVSFTQPLRPGMDVVPLEVPKEARPAQPPPPARALSPQEAAALGRQAHREQRYQDAAYHLAVAVAGHAFQGDDELDALDTLAHCLYTIGQPGRARYYAGQQLRTAQGIGQAAYAHRARILLAYLDLREGLLESAAGQARRVQRWAAAGGKQLMEAEALHTLASIERRQGNLQRTRQLYEQALDLGRSDENLTARTLTSLGKLEIQLGRLEGARRYLQRALLTYERRDAREDIAQVAHTNKEDKPRSEPLLRSRGARVSQSSIFRVSIVQSDMRSPRLRPVPSA